MRRAARPALRAMLLLAAAATPAQAATAPAATTAPATAVDVALVLVDDVSLSINDDEFALEKAGWEAAFADPRVIEAIRGGARGAIAVQYEEFASDFQVATLIDWTLIRDDASARAFVARLHATPRSARGRTAIGEGIAVATRSLADSGLDAKRRVIDVAGDGTSNAGRPAGAARDVALDQGITINGLAIANESPIPFLQRHTHPPGGLAHYYEQNVTGGEGSFVLEIHDYNSFGEAVLRKLLNEIAGTLPAGTPPAGARLAGPVAVPSLPTDASSLN